jgi:hypothetical protein
MSAVTQLGQSVGIVLVMLVVPQLGQSVNATFVLSKLALRHVLSEFSLYLIFIHLWSGGMNNGPVTGCNSTETATLPLREWIKGTSNVLTSELGGTQRVGSHPCIEHCGNFVVILIVIVIKFCRCCDCLRIGWFGFSFRQGQELLPVPVYTYICSGSSLFLIQGVGASFPVDRAAWVWGRPLLCM